MTLLVSRCESAILHALGMTALPPETSALEYIHAAGHWLCSFPWTWQERIGTLGVTASEAYVALTAGTVEVHRVQYQHRWLSPVSAGALLDMRAGTVVSTYPSCYAVLYDQTAAGVLTPRLELYPTPAATDATALKVYYRAGWAGPLADADGARIPIPAYLEAVYLEALIAFAMGREERDVADVGTRVAMVEAGPLFSAALRQDAALQTNHGPLRGGGPARHQYDGPSRNFRVQT
jgi:hypothetical protein